MRIKNTNKATVRHHNDDLMPDGYYVVYDEEHEDYNVANVRRSVGEALVESDDYPTVSAYEQPETENDETEENDSE